VLACRVCNAGFILIEGVCWTCPVGQYKDSAGNTQCTACTNGPASNKYYLARAASGLASLNDCPWDCNAGFKKNLAGTACEACSQGKYREAEQNRWEDTGASNSCRDCLACTTGQSFLTRACTTTRNAACTSCTTSCSAGSYKLRPCNVSADLACERCATRCPADKRLSGARCSGEDAEDTVLRNCVACATLASCNQAGFYLNWLCLGAETVSNECKACSTSLACTVDQYRGGCGGLSDTRCLAYTQCGVGLYLQDETPTKDGVCVACLVCPEGTSPMRPCTRYLDAVCKGKSCGQNDACPRRTPQNRSAYFCSYDDRYCGVCPLGYDGDGQYCLECPRGSTCDRVGQVACRGQCAAGVLSQCEEAFQGLGYAKCTTACPLANFTTPTRLPWRGSYAPAGAEDCATYFLCQPGTFKYFSTAGSVECRACTERRPTLGQLDRWVTDGLSVGDASSCLWECDRRVARWNGAACVARYAVSNVPASNAAGSWAGGACGQGRTSEALSTVEAGECLECKPLVADAMQWVARSEQCAWECSRSDDLQLGGECVPRRRDCAAPGWVQMTDGTCASTGYPWNRPGYAKLKPGWGAPVVTAGQAAPVDAQAAVLASRGYGWTGRHSAAVAGRPARSVEGALCSAARAWVGGYEYLFAAPCNRSFLVYLNLSAATGGLGVLIGNGTLGWADGFRTQALFENELYVASGGNGTLYVLDRWNCLLREVVVWDRPGSYLTRVYTVWGNREKLGLVPPEPKCYGLGALAWPRKFWALRDGWLAFADEDGLWQFHTTTRELLLMIKETDGSFEADALAGVDAQTDVLILRLYFNGGILWEVPAAQAECATDYTSLAGGDCSVGCRWLDAAGVPAQYVDNATGLCRACTPGLACGVGQERVACTARRDAYCRACPSLAGRTVRIGFANMPLVYTVAGACDESTLKPRGDFCYLGWYLDPTRRWCEKCPPFTTTLLMAASRQEQCKCVAGLTRQGGKCLAISLYAFENACALGPCRTPRNARLVPAGVGDCRWECNTGFYRDTLAGFDDQCRACLTREAGELEIFASALVYIWRTRGDDDAPYSCENGFNPYQP